MRLGLLLTLQGIMAAELLALFLQGSWASGAWLVVIMFVFAIAVGALWEIFEFAADQWFGMQMQKPMFGDPSGLTDTMWDLIVDTLGAGAISVFGWWHMKRSRRSFIDVWTDRFIAANPRLFSD
ncbi:MAG: hypothetical protein ABI671_02895 [Burkholderiales bacterium]